MTDHPDLKIALSAANASADIIRSYIDEQDLNIQLKGKNDLVTEADLRSEEMIIKTIKEAFPDDHILAEESTGIIQLPEGRVWIIDPLDGTTNFAHGFPVFCISIAMWENGNAKLGLVLEISSDEIFTAVKGQGAFRNGKIIKVSEIIDLEGSLIATGFPYNDLSMVDPYLNLFRNLMSKTHGLRRPGAAAWDLCNTACGRFEGFYEYGLSPWDVAAGSLIIEEAGGVVTDWNGGSDYLSGKRIIAGNKRIRDLLQQEIHKVFPEELRSHN